jgi:cell division septum initiation protein DivIVA
VRTLEQQIRSTDFALSRKGYDPSTVDEALNGFADDVALLLAELRKESIRVSVLERSLTFAQNGRSSTQSDLGAMMIEATEKREQLLAEARTRAKDIVDDATRRVAASIERPHSASTAADELLHEREINLALEEAAAIESAARDLAQRIRSDAESDAHRVLESARTAALQLEDVDTGTGVDGVELTQQYG